MSTVRLNTSMGPITVELDRERAPGTVENSSTTCAAAITTTRCFTGSSTVS